MHLRCLSAHINNCCIICEQQTGIKLTEAEIQQLIKELDKDGDGEINYR
jgi:Ca2+-binding EF-hand superfamily protein